MILYQEASQTLQVGEGRGCWVLRIQREICWLEIEPILYKQGMCERSLLPHPHPAFSKPVDSDWWLDLGLIGSLQEECQALFWNVFTHLSTMAIKSLQWRNRTNAPLLLALISECFHTPLLHGRPEGAVNRRWGEYFRKLSWMHITSPFSLIGKESGRPPTTVTLQSLESWDSAASIKARLSKTSRNAALTF